MLANHVFWHLMLFYTHLLLPSAMWLSIATFSFLFISNYTFFHIYKQRKNCKKNRKKVAKLQSNKVIDNYNFNYLYPYT